MEALRTLLAGGEVEWDGVIVTLLHNPVTGIRLPIDVPVWIAADGPQGFDTATRLGAGVVTAPIHGPNPVPVTGLCGLTYAGTVLDEDESFDSPRVIEAAGPGAALALHLGANGPLAGMDEAIGYAEAIAAVDERHRHLERYRGHLIDLNPIDRRFVNGEVIRRGSMTGTAVEIAVTLRASKTLAQLLCLPARRSRHTPRAPHVLRRCRTAPRTAGHEPSRRQRRGEPACVGSSSGTPPLDARSWRTTCHPGCTNAAVRAMWLRWPRPSSRAGWLAGLA